MNAAQKYASILAYGMIVKAKEDTIRCGTKLIETEIFADVTSNNRSGVYCTGKYDKNGWWGGNEIANSVDWLRELNINTEDVIKEYATIMQKFIDDGTEPDMAMIKNIIDEEFNTKCETHCCQSC